MANIYDNNRRAILAHLRAHGPATRQQLAEALSLSLPTVTGHLTALEESGHIHIGDPQQSTGGRRATTYVCTTTAHLAIGVSMRTTELTMVAVDLQGHTVSSRTRTLLYRNTDSYYQRMGEAVTEFAHSLTQDGAQVLGVAFAVVGTMSADGQSVVNGGETITLNAVSQAIALPTLMIRNAQARTMTELWLDPTLTDAVAIYLDRHPSGAVIANGELYQGPTLGNGGIGHMTLVPGGTPCYCGHLGCMSAYCSPETLTEDGESLPGFFSVLEQGEREHRERFNRWLDDVAQAIANIRAVLAVDILIGGEAMQYLDADDITQLHERVNAHTLQPGDEFTLRACRAPEHPCEVGAALQFIAPYIRDICGR